MNVAGTGLRQQHQHGGHPAGSWPNDQQIQQSAQQDPSDRLHRYVQCSKAVCQFSGTSYTTYLKSILFFSHPRSEGWQQHGHSFSVYLCSLSFRSIFLRGVLSSCPCLGVVCTCISVLGMLKSFF